MMKNILNKIKQFGLSINLGALIIMLICPVILVLLLSNKASSDDQEEFANYVQANHCYIFEYIQTVDGKIEKRWICNNDEAQNDNTDGQ
jgi:hypothetical protein